MANIQHITVLFFNHLHLEALTLMSLISSDDYKANLFCFRKLLVALKGRLFTR